jgi:outer membrane protein OmpA-like peptidoglycan-associated protein
MSFEDAKSFLNRLSALGAKRLLQRPVHQPEPAFVATGRVGNGACPNFATGSDQPLSSSPSALNELKDALAINSQLAIQVDGYTDNARSDAVNVPLSQKRALAVKRYFQQMAPLSFPETRFKSVSGHGSENPSLPTRRREARR